MKVTTVMFTLITYGFPCLLGLLAGTGNTSAGELEDPTFEALCQKAIGASRDPSPAVNDALPEELKKLTYDQYRDIRYKPERAIWKDTELPFQLQMFHRGFIHGDAVEIHIIRDDHRQQLRYDPQCFELPDALQSLTLPENLDFAGFRVHHPLNRSDYYDEFIVFLGASYFRAVAKGHVYGASARGLAVDTGMDRVEEFPIFKEYWIVQPKPEDTSLHVYALLTSPSVTGAYRFQIYPGLTTRVEVKAKLFLKRSDAKWGVAPLTSMFLRGEETPRPASDFRPEIHDSDGLLIADKDEWVWRPLAPRRHRQISRFEVSKLRGFGLLQRDRSLNSYADLEAHYDLRPSLWVEPGLHWPEGAVELVELPTNTEYADNIVAYWRPKLSDKDRGELCLDYQLSFLSGDPSQHLQAKATVTRHVPTEAGHTRFLIDFESTRHFDAGVTTGCDPVITADRAEVRYVSATKNRSTGGWRIMFDCAPQGADPVTLRAYLKCDDRVISETWSYLWQPK